MICRLSGAFLQGLVGVRAAQRGSAGEVGLGSGLLPGWATLAVVAPFAGAAVRRTGERPLIVGGLTLFAAGLIWETLIIRTGLPYWELIAPMIVTGCGISMAIPAVQATVMSSVPAAAIGQASGVFNTLRQLGGVFGVAACAAVFAARGGYGSPAAFTAGFGPAMGVCAALAIGGVIAGLILPRRSPITTQKPALTSESSPRLEAKAAK